MTEQKARGESSDAGARMAGPGRVVRDARLRRDMTVDQVAEALHLDRATVERLEADDFDALPPLTFVRGYLRAYCQLLELDPQPVIERLADVGISDADNPLRAHAGLAAGNARAPRPVSRGPGFLGLALGLALLIAAVVAIGWWLSRAELPIPFLGGAGEATQAVVGDNTAAPSAPALDAPAATASDGEADAAPVPQTETTPAPQADDATPTPQTDTTPAPPADDATPTPQTETTPAPPADDATPAPQADTTPTPPDPTAAEAPAPARDGARDGAVEAQSEPTADRNELVFRFGGDSWMEVTDNRGERLLFGMAEPGEVRLTGEAPFDIVIGNTRNVRLEYRDETIDLEQYARGNVARFTLGGS